MSRKEIWKPIPDYEEFYLISSKGKVKSLRTNKVLRESQTGSGYNHVTLCVNKIKKSYMTHRLVAQAFIPNPNKYPEINHKDENKLNNCVENLEWCTKSYNERHGTKRFRANLHRDNHLIALKGAQKHNYKEIARLRSVAVNQYSLDDKFIKQWGSMREIARELNLAVSGISLCCRGFYKNYKGFIWRIAI